MKYDLYIVIVHYGPSISSGHYYTFIRCAPNEWYKFDDERLIMFRKILFWRKRHISCFMQSEALRDFSITVKPTGPSYVFVIPTNSNDTSYGTSLKLELNKIEDNDSHDQFYCEDQLQDVEIKKNEELINTLNCNSHGSCMNEKKRKLED
ncbi:hypothetical protein RDI58_019720 [Solanum bulbocastanum]|uniref:USP domain-containing protein n=1 Tax=Solanum bulbocastanum TaxID=147425 RepID=A0AAN8T8M8_SOLBU